MIHTEQRKKLRTLLAGSKCLAPGCVFDPLSARVAESVGYEIGFIAGSVASYTTLAAPDLIVLTLTEVADQIRRIMRVSKLSLMIDGDHGYGNALNVMRTVQEFEHAGISAITIQDTLPKRFGQPDGTDELSSVEEMIGKLRAAVQARQDPSLVIVGRTAALKVEDTDRAVARARAYAAAGVDAIYLERLKTLQQIEAIQAAVKLPIMLGGSSASLNRDDLAARGARILVQEPKHLVAAAVLALREAYTHLFNGGAPADLKPRLASSQDIDKLIDAENYQKWQREFLR